MQESNNQQATPQGILKQIVAQFGKQIFNKSASARLESVLSDYLTNDKVKLKLFRQAVKDGIAHELLQSDGLDKVEKTIKINALKIKFQSENCYEKAIACEIVDGLAYALGWNVSAKRETKKKPLPVKKENPPAVKQPIDEKTELKQLHRNPNENWKYYKIYENGLVWRGYKDEYGNIVIPAQFFLANPFREGLAVVLDQNHKWGVIDAAGAKICPSKYDWVKSFSEGLAAVLLNNYWGFIDYSGKLVIPLKYNYVYESFKNGKVQVKEKEELYYIDKSGKRL